MCCQLNKTMVITSRFNTNDVCFIQGRNPEASEFVPKSGGSSSRDSPNLTHSASTPSFPSFAHMGGLGAGGTIPNPTAAGNKFHLIH